MLCDVCKSINFFAWGSWGNPHHANLHAVFQAAEQGCELCRKLRIEVECSPLPSIVAGEVILPPQLDMESRILYSILINLSDRTPTIDAVLFQTQRDGFKLDLGTGRPKRGLCTIFEIYVEHDCAPELARVISGRPSFATPYSDGCFSLINTWMRQCTERHGGHCPSETEAPLPTRVLDIGIGGGNGSIFLKVANPREVGAYVTLSHCVSLLLSVSLVLFVVCRLRNTDLIQISTAQWGPKTHFSTTLSNIADFKQSVSLEELPSTFRDAILVTRKLGFRFLWIDSLCIIQDSHEDWVQEAASMHLYYRRSALTIAVDCARGDYEGFLHLTRENDPPVAILPSAGPPLEQVSSASLSPGQSVPVAQSPIGDILLRRIREQDKDHLSERGWTLQETILSPRTIHYSATELKWGCQKRSCSERSLFSRSEYSDKKNGFLSLSNFLTVDGAFKRWYRILDDYATRALSVSSDKLPAISGLAREFHSQINSTYKAGIWLEDIHCGLIWSYSEHGIKPDSYRAPSWSWAAMDCFRTGNSLNMYRHSFATSFGPKPFCKAEVLNCVVTLKDNDPYGAVLGGELTLRAFWINWPRKQIPGLDKMWNLPPCIFNGDLFYGDLGCTFDEIAKKGFTYSNPDYYLDVSLLRIRRDEKKHFALLLKPAKGERNEGKFVRVGIAHLPCELDNTQLERGGWVKRDVTII
jgi:hypothetical protein